MGEGQSQKVAGFIIGMDGWMTTLQYDCSNERPIDPSRTILFTCRGYGNETIYPSFANRSQVPLRYHPSPIDANSKEVNTSRSGKNGM